MLTPNYYFSRIDIAIQAAALGFSSLSLTEAQYNLVIAALEKKQLAKWRRDKRIAQTKAVLGLTATLSGAAYIILFSVVTGGAISGAQGLPVPMAINIMLGLGAVMIVTGALAYKIK